MPNWTLIDGVERNREFPETFWLPDASDLTGLDPGDLVKLGFEWAGGGERMWVRIVERSEETCAYIGVVENTPVFAESPGYGQRVLFEPRHILNFEAASAGSGPDSLL